MKSSPNLAPAAVAAVAALEIMGCEQPVPADVEGCPLVSSSRSLSRQILDSLDPSLTGSIVSLEKGESCQVTLASTGYDSLTSRKAGSSIELRLTPEDVRVFFDSDGDNFEIFRARALGWMEAAISSSSDASCPGEGVPRPIRPRLIGESGVLTDAYVSRVSEECEGRLTDIAFGETSLTDVREEFIRVVDRFSDRDGCTQEVYAEYNGESDVAVYGDIFSHYFLPGRAIDVRNTWRPVTDTSMRTLVLTGLTTSSGLYHQYLRDHGYDGRPRRTTVASPSAWLDREVPVCLPMWDTLGKVDPLTYLGSR